MRNLKKILALVLALVMSLSLMATAGAADFSDKDQITDKYSDAVTVLNGLEVFKGYDNGATFQPQGDITRAEVAAIIYRIATGDVTDAQKDIYSSWGLFTDVVDGSWYAGYVNYCANAGYIKGRGNKIFDPNGKVTGYEALAMILRAVGYDKNNEFSGSNWQVNTASIAKQRGITNNITDTLLGGPATREVVAEILFQAILVPTVTFNTATLSYTTNATSLGKDVLNLDKVTGVVVANEYANVQDDDLAVLAEGKTQLRVAAGDVRTLDYATDLTDIGMSQNAYIQGSKVLLIAEGANTVFDNTDTNGKHVDISSASKFSSVSGMSKNDDTDFFVNFDHNTRHEANRRIEMRVTFNGSAAEDAFDRYAGTDISRIAYASGYTVTNEDTNTRVTLGANDTDYEQVLGAAYASKITYLKVFRVDTDELTDDDLKVIKGIFGMADDDDATTWSVSGSVYVGTNSKDIVGWSNYAGDKSNDMSYTAFKAEYINDTVDKKWSTSDDGEWVKIIDNDGDGYADYAFLTQFDLDKAVNTYTKNDESTLRYYHLDLINDDDVEKVKYMNTVAEGDIVLHVTIDKQALVWKANSVEDEVTKINDIYSRDVTATTAGGTTYSQSEIDNYTRLDQRIDQMSETVNYRMYLDAFGRIRAYEPVDGTKYALITELYYGNIRNGRYVYNDVLTAELKAGDAAITERVVNNPLNNDFILNYTEDGGTARDNWTGLNNVMTAYTRSSTITDYVTNLYVRAPIYNGQQVEGNWSDYVVLQPATSNLGYISSVSARSIFRNATTNVARYVVNADGTVNLSTAAQLNYASNGTLLNNSYAVNYVELSNTSVSSKQNVYNAKNPGASFDSKVDATNETEYYIVANGGVEHFVGYSNLPAISGIRSMYAVARNTSSDRVNNNYWVAEVVVIEADNYAAQPDDYIFVVGRADMVGNGAQSNSRMAAGSQYLYAISAKNGVVRIAPSNISWGAGTVDPGFYKAYGVAQRDDGIYAVDRLTKVDPRYVNDARYPDSVNTSSFKLRAGIVTKTAAMNDRFEVQTRTTTDQITLKGPSLTVVQDNRGYITVSTRLDGDNWSNQVIKDRRILWVEDSSKNAQFVIDVTQSTKTYPNTTMSTLLWSIFNAVYLAAEVKDGYNVTVYGCYTDATTNKTKTDAPVYLEQINGTYLNAATGANGASFRVAKDGTLLFKPVAGVGYKLTAATGAEQVVIYDTRDDAKSTNNFTLNKRTIGGDTWYEVTNIKGNIDINVMLETDATNTAKVLVTNGSTSDKITGTKTKDFANIEKGSGIILGNVPTGYAVTVNSVMVGFTKLTAGTDYEYDAQNKRITFLKDIANSANKDIVIDVTISKITEVEREIIIPAVNEKADTSARNSRMAGGKTPLFFVNNDRNLSNYVLSGANYVYSLAAVKVGTTVSISFQYNEKADTTSYGSAVYITIADHDEKAFLPLVIGGTATLTYTVEAIVETDIVKVEGNATNPEPTVTIEGTSVEAGGSVEVYKVNNDTQGVYVTVQSSVGSANISVSAYAVDSDTSAAALTGVGSVSGTVSVPTTGNATIRVVETIGDDKREYTYTVTFVAKQDESTNAAN